MRVDSKDYEIIYDKLDDLWDSVKDSFYKTGGEKSVEVDMNKIKIEIDLMISLLKNLKTISPAKTRL
jgi:hypothetical protein